MAFMVPVYTIGSHDVQHWSMRACSRAVEVVPVGFGGQDDELPAEQGSDDGIDRKAILRHDHLGAGRNQRVAEELDDFVRAVAEDQVGRRHAELGGELLLQIERIAIRVEVDLRQRLAHGSQGEAGRAERVFVRGDLDDAVGGQPEFAGDFLDRPARLIDRHRVKVWVVGVGEGHGKSLVSSASFLAKHHVVLAVASLGLLVP